MEGKKNVTYINRFAGKSTEIGVIMVFKIKKTVSHETSSTIFHFCGALTGKGGKSKHFE